MLVKDVLIPAKIFCLTTQNNDPNIIKTVKSVERAKKDYKKHLKKFDRYQDLVFELRILKTGIANKENEKLIGHGSTKVRKSITMGEQNNTLEITVTF